jgi:predicted metalloprotease with PDZ domain
LPERPDILPPESPFEITPAIPQIGGIIDGGPAEAAGLEEGDLIARIDSQLILSQADLLEQLGRHAPGDQVEVTVRRGREILSFMVRLGRHPDDQTRAYLGIELGSPFLHPPIDPSRVPDLDG